MKTQHCLSRTLRKTYHAWSMHMLRNKYLAWLPAWLAGTPQAPSKWPVTLIWAGLGWAAGHGLP
eukprot:975453-Heterocapsa_arctica.AAC.1